MDEGTVVAGCLVLLQFRVVKRLLQSPSLPEQSNSKQLGWESANRKFIRKIPT